MKRCAIVVLCWARLASADERREDASLHDIFAGPFQSSRLFSMPVADTVGAYMVSVSGEGSLLQQPGVLTSAGVLAIGFGDIAQLEYRHTGAISVTGVDAPLPAVGVQLKLPIPDRPNVPAIGVAFRLGVPREEGFSGVTVTERVTDFYLVARERLAAVPWLTLHAGARVSPASIELSGTGFAANCRVSAPSCATDKTLVLPTGGVEIAVNREARAVGEVGLVPQFHWMPGDQTALIGSGVLARLGLRWALLPAVTFDASFGYQLDAAMGSASGPRDVVQQWDIRLGAEVFVPWGALACRAVGIFCG